VVWVMRDITERKQAEEQLRAAHKEVREKNAQLAELNTSKDKLFSIISHDLRSPFNVMLGYFQQIDEQFDRYTKKELKQIIENLRISAEKLKTLLENLLTWSRIQRGAMRYSPECFDLREVAEENIELFLSKAAQKQITLTNAIAGGTQVYADFHMLNAIFRNLLSNALKFTTSGGQIEIAACENEADIEIAVSDTGTGIPADALPKLFRLDVQYTNTGTAGEEGTGLGLNLCKDLVEKNGGTIWAESEIGHGTTFTFTLPKPKNDR
jgi:two-component system sensor histidine kinase/response regulator